MSFGFNEGDFTAAIKLANSIRKEFVNGPSQFNATLDELRSLSIILQDTDVAFPNEALNNDQRRDLEDVDKGCRDVFDELLRILNKISELRPESGRVSKRTKRVWKTFDWEPEDGDELRSLIHSNISFLNAFNKRHTRKNVLWDNDAQLEIIDGLCEKCRYFVKTIGNEVPERLWHHDSHQNLERAADLGCLMCKMLLERPHASFGFRSPSTRIMNPILIAPRPNQQYTTSRWDVQIKTHVSDLKLAIHPDDPLTKKWPTKYRPIARHTTAELCASFAQTQLQRCQENHSEICLSNFEAQMPSRVLDLVAEDTIQVVTTENLVKPWVAVSYCWGSDGAVIKATKATMPTFMSGFRILSLPKTFRDVIEVVKQIGFRYIWIDALCIIQDDPEDMDFELRGMGRVYSGAVLTIAVESAGSVSKGFIGERNPPVSTPVDIPYTCDSLGIEGVLQIRTRRHPRYVFDLLGLRGWALQEAVLSPRTLHIGQEQLYWSCRKYYCCEGNPDEGKAMDGQLLKRITHDEDEDSIFVLDQRDLILRRWYILVSNFARRSFTFEKDLFPAIAGLAEIVHHEINSDYLAGLWDDDIEQSLLWRLNQNGQEPHSYRAPSWSWTALHIRPSDYGFIDGRKDQSLYGHITGSEFDTLTSDIDWLKYSEYPTEKPPRFHIPPVKGSYLQLRCNIVPASDWPISRDPPFCNLRDRQWDTYSPVPCSYCWLDGSYGDNQKEGPKMGQIVCDFDVPTTEKEMDSEQFVDISYAWIAHTQGDGGEYYGEPTFPHDILWCLMLKKLGDSDEEFKRVGLARIPSSDRLTPAPWQVRTIQIF